MKIKITQIILMLIIMTLFVNSCDILRLLEVWDIRDDTDSSVTTVCSVVINNNNITEFFPGDVLDFTATVRGENNPPQTVVWELLGNNSSSTSLDSNGRLSVSDNETSEMVTIRATSTFDTNKSGELKIIYVKDIITFGGYEWRVLERRDDMALVISRNILSQREYYDILWVSITWENSSIRAYLNGDFYNSFSSADRARIVEVTNINENNQYHGTNGGNPTQDRIFLLSLAEIVQYFGDSGQLGSTPLIDDQYNANRIATYNGSAFWWWLRSPGFDTNLACVIYTDGHIFLSGSFVQHNIGGVRPALWLNL